MLLISDLHFGVLLPSTVENFILNAALADIDKLVLISGYVDLYIILAVFPISSFSKHPFCICFYLIHSFRDITTNSKKEEFERAEKFFGLLLQVTFSQLFTPYHTSSISPSHLPFPSLPSSLSIFISLTTSFLITKNGIGIAATPGNHDFGGWSAELLHKVTTDYTRARGDLDRLFQPLYKV